MTQRRARYTTGGSKAEYRPGNLCPVFCSRLPWRWGCSSRVHHRLPCRLSWPDWARGPRGTSPGAAALLVPVRLGSSPMMRPCRLDSWHNSRFASYGKRNAARKASWIRSRVAPAWTDTGFLACSPGKSNHDPSRNHKPTPSVYPLGSCVVCYTTRPPSEADGLLAPVGRSRTECGRGAGGRAYCRRGRPSREIHQAAGGRAKPGRRPPLASPFKEMALSTQRGYYPSLRGRWQKLWGPVYPRVQFAARPLRGRAARHSQRLLSNTGS